MKNSFSNCLTKFDIIIITGIYVLLLNEDTIVSLVQQRKIYVK